MYQKTIIDNGLRVWIAPMEHTRSVSIGIFLAAGSCYEPEDWSGSAHFVEHMLFKGTQKRPTSQDISEAIEGVGGIINGETGKELAVYWAKVAEPHWELALDVLTDMVLHPLFEPNEVEKERRVIVEELNTTLDDPREYVDILFDRTMWGDHPLGRDVGGTRESISGMSREDLLQYKSWRYVPLASVVCLAGAVKNEEVLNQLSRRLDSWDGEAKGDWVPVPEPQSQAGVPRSYRGVRVHYKDTEQAHLCLGVRGLSYRHPDRIALDLLNVILGEGMSSRLFLEIRERRGLAYDVHSYINHFRDAGSAIVYAGVDTSRIDQTITALLEEFDRIQKPVSQAEITRAKEYWKGRLLLRMEDSRSIVSWLGGQELLLDKVLTVDEVIEAIDKLSIEDLQRVAQQCFYNQDLTLAIVGPYDDEERFARLLKG